MTRALVNAKKAEVADSISRPGPQRPALGSSTGSPVHEQNVGAQGDPGGHVLNMAEPSSVRVQGPFRNDSTEQSPTSIYQLDVTGVRKKDPEGQGTASLEFKCAGVGSTLTNPSL